MLRKLFRDIILKAKIESEFDFVPESKSVKNIN